MRRLSRLISVIALFVLILSAAPARAQIDVTGPPGIDARAVVLIDAASGRVLYGQNADQPLPMASTTKIMTAILLLEKFDSNDILWVPFEVRGIDGSKIYLEPGERYTARDLLHALMIESGNDVAIAIAVNVAGSVEDFVRLMNQKARELGLENTSFANPHGLDAPGHQASAHDLAVMARHGMADRRFREAVSVTESIIPDPIRQSERVLRSHNLFLVRYPHATGVKTGYTGQAGFSLVGSAERDGVALIGTILGGSSAERVASDMENLMEWGFETFSPRVLLGTDQVLTLPDPDVGEEPTGEPVYVKADRAVTALFPKNEPLDPDAVEVKINGDYLEVNYAGELIDRVTFQRLSGEALRSALTGAEIVEPVYDWRRNTVVGAGGLLLALFMLVSRRRRRNHRRRWPHVRGWSQG